MCDDDSTFLLCAASRLLRNDDDDDSGSAHHDLEAPTIVEFPSFQALLHAATSAAPVVVRDRVHGAAPRASRPESSSPAAESARSTDVNARTEKRRERNRISCRKTRLKRKVQQSSAELLTRKRVERNTFLHELHREVVATSTAIAEQSSSSCVASIDQKRIARHFVARSVHFQLADPAYDASWCFELPHGATSARPTKRTATPHALDALFRQWRAVTAAFEVADLDVLSVRESGAADTLRCEWRVAGASLHDLQHGRDAESAVRGETIVCFCGSRIASIELRVTAPSAVAAVV